MSSSNTSYRVIIIVMISLIAGCTGGSSQKPEICEGEQLSSKSTKHSPIAIAVDNGNTKQVEVLLVDGADPNERLLPLKLSMPLISVAASTGDTATIKVLLNHGAIVDLPDRTGTTALAYAVLWQATDTVKLLLDHGANPNSPNIEGDTPLHDAALSNDFKIAGMLIRAGARKNTEDIFGKTAAMTAKEQGYDKLAKYLAPRENVGSPTKTVGK